MLYVTYDKLKLTVNVRKKSVFIYVRLQGKNKKPRAGNKIRNTLKQFAEHKN